MITKTIHYEDFDGNMVTEQAYFHVTDSDMAEAFASYGDLGANMDRSVMEKNPTYFLNAIRNIVRISYGKKLPDGRFIKFDSEGRRLGDYFIGTNAYSELINDLLKEDNAIPEFVKGLFSASTRKKLEEALAEHPEMIPNGTI